MSEPNQGVILDHDGRVDWLATRRQGVGASEVSILFGLAPASWGSPYSMWLEKTGRLTKEVDQEAEWLEIGRRMEPVVCDMYAQRTGRKFWDGGGKYVVAIDPVLDVLRATPDRWILGSGADGMDGNGVLETKNVGAFLVHDWDDATPPHVECQVQAQLACTGYKWGSAAGILGGNSFVSRDILRNDAFIGEIRATVEEFWGYVKRDKPPPIDASDATTRALKALHPHDSGDEVELPALAGVWWQAIVEAKEAIKTVAKIEGARKDECENKLREAIGSATYGRLPDGRRLSLKTTSRDGYTVQPTSYRVLRIESTRKGK